MKKLLMLLLTVFLVTTMVSCGNSSTENTDTTKDVANEATTEAVNMIEEAEAKEVVFNDLSIQETAANNLTVKLENNSYVIAFDWSGFDYQYTIDATTGEIIEILFDGEVL